MQSQETHLFSNKYYSRIILDKNDGINLFAALFQGAWSLMYKKIVPSRYNLI